MTPDLDSQRRYLKPGLDALPAIERTVENGVLREVRQFRGITLDQAVRYLEHLGGERRSATDVTGDGWQAHLSARRVPVGPSYRLTEVTITWTGDRTVLEPLIFRFRLKAFRAPG
jgi:hypothetical protein